MACPSCSVGQAGFVTRIGGVARKFFEGERQRDRPGRDGRNEKHGKDVAHYGGGRTERTDRANGGARAKWVVPARGMEALD